MAVYFAQTSNFQNIDSSCQQLQKVFQTIDAESCPLAFNFHMHTVCSDGRLKPEEAIEQAISIGLQGLAITDHHTIGGYRAAQRYLAQQQVHHPDLEGCLPQLWSGVEINAGLLNAEVHILAYAFDPQHARMQPYLQRRAATGEAYFAASVIGAVHEAGGLAVLAHPARYKRSPFDLISAASQLGIDGVETYYAYNNPHPWRPSPQETQQVYHLAQKYRLLNTCGTDTHGRSLLQRL